jgi:hypothetical protein
VHEANIHFEADVNVLSRVSRFTALLRWGNQLVLAEGTGGRTGT